MSEFNVARTVGQAAVKVVSIAEVTEVSGNFMLKKFAAGEVANVVGIYMRDARILDMAKPLYVAGVVGQAAMPVMTKAKLNEVAVIVLQSQRDRQIRPAPGGLQQKRIY